MESKPKNHRKPLSRYFPAHHSRRGQPTYFVQKMLNSIGVDYSTSDFTSVLIGWNKSKINKTISGDFLSDFKIPFYHLLNNSLIAISELKHHTIRAGNKVKVGDTITFYVWSGKPYCSPQIVVSPPIEVKKVWNFAMIDYAIYIEDIDITSHYKKGRMQNDIAMNDGLNWEDLASWFKGNSGPCQIICWNDKIQYT